MFERPHHCLLALVLTARFLNAQEEGKPQPLLPLALDEIEVTATHSILREEPTSPVALSREQIERLPHFGDDLFRAVSALPGTSSDDFSAAFNVRGGFNSEILTRIDGVEIFEPFHLKDFQGVSLGRIGRPLDRSAARHRSAPAISPSSSTSATCSTGRIRAASPLSARSIGLVRTARSRSSSPPSTGYRSCLPSESAIASRNQANSVGASGSDVASSSARVRPRAVL